MQIPIAGRSFCAAGPYFSCHPRRAARPGSAVLTRILSDIGGRRWRLGSSGLEKEGGSTGNPELARQVSPGGTKHPANASRASDPSRQFDLKVARSCNPRLGPALERIPLGTSYPGVVAHVGRPLAKLASRRPGRSSTTRVWAGPSLTCSWPRLAPVGMSNHRGTAETHERAICSCSEVSADLRLAEVNADHGPRLFQSAGAPGKARSAAVPRF
jgi:hypothetical protein